MNDGGGNMYEQTSALIHANYQLTTNAMMTLAKMHQEGHQVEMEMKKHDLENTNFALLKRIKEADAHIERLEKRLEGDNHG